MSFDGQTTNSRWLNCLYATLTAMMVSHAVAQEPTWRSLENMSPEDLALYDPARATPRDTAIPYIPAEPYPFEAPYTSEEIGYRSAEFPHVPRWSASMIDVYGVVTSSGYINQGASVFFQTIHGTTGLGGYIHDTTPGDVYARWAFYDTFPPESEGAQQLWTPFRTDNEFRTKMDFFIYSPQLRRVRRQPEPRRDQRFPDNSQTFDDVLGRDPWELEWQLLGTDVLFETVRFPNTRPTITLNISGQGFVERQTASLKLMGDNFDHYGPGGGTKCWVIKATMKPDWLPGYKERNLVLWLEQTTFYPLRIEKYGHDGRLMLIEERIGKKENPALGEFGYTALASVYWNLDHDLVSYSFHDALKVRDWTKEQEKMIFTAEFMRRQWLFEPIKSQMRIDSPDKFFLRSYLYPDKFTNDRNVTLPPEIDLRYRAQEAAGHLIFETGVFPSQSKK